MIKRVLFVATLSCGDNMSFEPGVGAVEIGNENGDGSFSIGELTSETLSKEDLAEVWTTIGATLRYMKENK